MSTEADRKALFELLLAESGWAGAAAGPTVDAIVPGAVDAETAPLSFAQQRLWFLEQFEPGGSAYHVPGALRLRGTLDAAALASAVRELAIRHDVLRTVFGAEGDEPVARVLPDLRPDWTVVDLRGQPVDDREAGWREQARGEAAKTFDLARGPLLRGVLVQLADDDHVLLLTMHHIISDQWSLSLLAQELSAGYAAARGQGPGPVRPAVQYGDFARWQRRWGTSAACREQVDFWRRQLAGVTPLELPTDFARPAEPSPRGGTANFRIPAAARAALTALARAEGGTAFMALLAVFKVLLLRYTGQADLAVGSPVTGRARAETAPLIGFFTNTLVLRTTGDGHRPFVDWLRAVRETCQAAYAHQEVPFELLAEELQPVRELNRNPFFDVMFVHQTELPALVLAGVEASFLPTEIPDAKFDLTLTVRDAPDGGWDGWVEYRTDLFRPETMARMGQHFATLLAAAALQPDQAVLDLPMMAAPERRQVLETFNATACEFPATPAKRLHELVTVQAQQSPERLAVRDGAEALTYAQLETRSNQLAQVLRARGVGPDVIVGLCLGRTVDMIVAVLGVMKAGGCYLPLDPGYPADRLAFMLADAAAPVLVLHAETRTQLELPGDIAVVDLDRDADQLAAAPDAVPVSGVAPDHLAYIIYTSGSTGRPKGTTLSHRAMMNLIRWHHATLLTGARGLFFASLSFDVSFHDLFAVLGSGGQLHIADEAMRGDTALLVECIEQQQIEKIILPVVVLQQLAADYADQTARFASLRELTTTGEALILTPAVLDFCRALPDCVFHNHYGPSETHVVTAYTFDGPPRRLNPPPPIGRPIANTQIYLLDARLNPVPVGVPGELYIGGANLGRDYHRRPSLTAERFVPHPFARRPGERLYRTGDRARWLPDGNIEFFGRLDDQVKIRGFRVELGEVETHLLEYPAVVGAAVALRERPTGEACLAAYVALAADVEVPSHELRAFLNERVPDYMVPAAFVVLPALPLTPSGKINRRALPALSAADFGGGAEHEPPADASEALVGEIWADLLGVPRVGRQDDFFHLGGHSLLATRVIARLRHRTTLEVPLRALFERSTLAQFTAAVAEVAGGKDVLATIVETVREVEAESIPEPGDSPTS